MHACTQQFVDRTSASVRLFDSFVNLDSCVEDGFFFFFRAWIRRIRPIFSLPQLAFDLTSTPTIPDSCRQRSSISLTAVPRNHVEHSFRKHVSFEHSVSSPRPVITSRREKKTTTTRPKFFSTQSTVSPLHAPSAAGTCCLHVLSELGRGAASFLATESTGTVLIPRLMTRIAGHGDKHVVGQLLAAVGRNSPGRGRFRLLVRLPVNTNLFKVQLPESPIHQSAFNFSRNLQTRRYLNTPRRKRT